MIPNFEHDCDCCKLINNDFSPLLRTKIDSYLCSASDNMPNIVIRYSNEPSDYVSGIIAVKMEYKQALSTNPLITVRDFLSNSKNDLHRATLKAIDLGLLDENFNLTSNGIKTSPKNNI